jgi:hypothetical protein
MNKGMDNTPAEPPGFFSSLKNSISGLADKVRGAVTSVVPATKPLSTDEGVAKIAGAKVDARGGGYTMTGGRRYKKKKGKKPRKTKRRSRH